MSSKNYGEKLLKRVAKEIASEVLLKKKDPTYIPVLNKDDCAKRLSIILEKPKHQVLDDIDRLIRYYLKSPELLQ